MKVSELTPGDLIKSFGMEAIFICQVPHPYFTGFQLVIWRVSYGDGSRFSFDALKADQEVGDPMVLPESSRKSRLQNIFTSLDS